MTWFWLSIAIVTEVTATMMLRQSQGFSQLLPSVVVVFGYATAFYALSQALVHGMTIGTAYAIWCGIGITLIAILGAVIFDERPTPVQLVGIVVVTFGIVTVQLGSPDAAGSAAPTAPSGDSTSLQAGAPGQLRNT
ncbi:DMT family transporter [Nocardioides daejeonensis]|uniref:DMT family transporter n=1 Tax=Nocardioides daejeonensis TaxID=1046556 RepID=UPI000D74BC6D|nr:multidrug efflux SMR transporter [Nocardioides daejeonensis]